MQETATKNPSSRYRDDALKQSNSFKSQRRKPDEPDDSFIADLSRKIEHFIGSRDDTTRRRTPSHSKRHRNSRNSAEMLDVVIDADSASAHRGYRPPQELIEQMLTVAETIIRDHYIGQPILASEKKTHPSAASKGCGP